MESHTLAWGFSPGRPSLLHPGVGRSWWTPPDHNHPIALWNDGENLWILRGEQVKIFPFRGDIDVIAMDKPNAFLIQNSRGDSLWIRTESERRIQSSRRRYGRDIAMIRDSNGWHYELDHQLLETPEGVKFADQVWPWRTGIGCLWTTSEWIYRQAWEQPARAIARLSPGQRLIPGPIGAFVIVERGFAIAFASPTTSPELISNPLRVEAWGLRWADDGSFIEGIDEADNPWRIGMNGVYRLTYWPTGAKTRGFDPIHRDIQIDNLHIVDLCEASWAHDNAVLAGPGGRLWDLRKLCTVGPSIVQLGATVATSSHWATADWSTGKGCWMEPTHGRTMDIFQIPLEVEDWIDEGFALENTAVFLTAHGHQYQVRGSHIQPIEGVDPPKSPSNRGPGWILNESGLKVVGWPQIWALPFEAATRVNDYVFGWNTDGLLVAIPVLAP